MSVDPTSAKVIQPLDVDYDAIRSSNPHRMVHGVEARLIRLRQQAINVWTAVQAYRSPAGIRAVIARLKEHRALASGGKRVVKLVSAAGRNHWRLFIPANTSPLHVPFLKGELNRLVPHSRGGHELAVVFLSVTKKCPLKCEHCFEWDNLNQKEVIGPEDINHMIENLQSMGATNIAFTGGEPMLRVREMAESIRRYKSKSQFWILTSGFNFTAANAAELRSAGAHGVVVSIDHYDPLAHDQFRGTQGSFRDAITAVKHALDQGYLTAISTCVTRENANREYIDAFMDLAKSLGVGFVQWIEPKAVGH
ncbi:MAG: radical SAM protein, partial [Flavobacteriales bacterium]